MPKTTVTTKKTVPAKKRTVRVPKEKTATASPEEKVQLKKIKASDIKVGEIISFTYYTKVKTIDSASSIVVKDLYSKSKDPLIGIRGLELVENCFSADQYATEVKSTKTEMAEKLIYSSNRPFTVCFEKADGTERTLRGRLISHESLLGRSMVEDLDIEEGYRTRLVDHRTIRSLILNNVKYTEK